MQWQMPVECPVKVKMRNIAAEHNRSALTLIAEVQTGMDFRRYGQEETFDLVLFISEFHGNADRPINALPPEMAWPRGSEASRPSGCARCPGRARPPSRGGRSAHRSRDPIVP